MSKQDRQGVRTPADLERKYDFGQTYAQQTNQIKHLGSLVGELSNMVSGVFNSLSEVNEDIAEVNNAVAEVNKSIGGVNESIAGINEDIAKLEEIVPGLVDIGQDVAVLKEGAEMLVTVQTDSLETESITADKTFAEIDAAILAGRNVRVKLVCESDASQLYLCLTSHIAGSEVNFTGHNNGAPIVLQLFAESGESDV